MIIYLTTNLINNKKYIGKDEKNRPFYLGSGLLLKKAIIKYGKNNFKKEILALSSSREELNNLEKFYIDKFDAVNSDNFYNLAKGGTGGKLFEKHKSSKNIYQYSKTGDFIKKWENAREAADFLNIQFSKLNMCARGERNSAHGFIWKYEYFNNIIPYKLHKGQKVAQLDENGNILNTFLSLRKAALFFNKKRPTELFAFFQGKKLLAYGYKWKYLD